MKIDKMKKLFNSGNYVCYTPTTGKYKYIKLNNPVFNHNIIEYYLVNKYYEDIANIFIAGGAEVECNYGEDSCNEYVTVSDFIKDYNENLVYRLKLKIPSVEDVYEMSKPNIQKENFTPIKPKWYDDDSNFPALVYDSTSKQLRLVVCEVNITGDERLATKQEIDSLHYKDKQ